MEYYFQWDPRKAMANRRKHAVPFEQAVTVFRDPRALSIYDVEHSEHEDRWVTLGISAAGGLLVVHPTYQRMRSGMVRIRIISCRKATRRESRQYAE